MSNRIEEAIRKILFTRKQQDVLLEQIIKQALLEGKTVAKIKDATRAEQQEGKQAGAVVVYAVVMRNISEQNISKGVLAATNAVGLKDPNKRESKQIDIGPNSIYATTTGDFIEDPINSEQSQVRTRGEYKYFVGNINKTGNRIRCVVWIIPMKLWQQYEQLVLTDEYYQTDRSYSNAIGSAAFANTIITTMKSWIKRSESRANDPYLDRKWYIENNEGELKPLPPESWYKFAGLTPNKAVALETSSNTNSDPAPDNVNVQDDIVEVTDQPIGNSGGVFTGKYNATKQIPINGTFKQRNTTLIGTFSYDATSNDWWFSEGTWQTPDQIRIGKFTKNGVFTDGEYQFTNREPEPSMPDLSYRVYHGFKTAGDIDITNDKSKLFAYDANNKLISYYEGTFNLDGNPKNGTVYNDDTKSTTIGTFTNGKYADVTK